MAGYNTGSSRTEPFQSHKPQTSCIRKPNPPENCDNDGELGIYLTGLCHRTVELIPGAAMVGVTLVDPQGTPVTVARTVSAVDGIDAAQYQAGRGPGLEAVAAGIVVTADRVDAARRWPMFAQVASTFGVYSFLSTPLPSLRPGMPNGAVNVYGARDSDFQDTDTAFMNSVVAAAGYAIAGAERYRDSRNLSQHLEHALHSRGVIDQAKGIIMVMRGVDADTAFRMLIDTSQRTNKKVRVVAEELLASICI
ncbi:GAF and ANTAR domain-containing protein [Rhodococcus globerulus]|uniref:GAF and ANTAR domain-containing protein n=1 Tax=Rhodococcus globerulus TaxID=33008 RepID=A0ABU4C4F8_RHOGO|nr:GAF and ANTAR domain-containing protein [Rhodococcus globerulus]MDV6271385.1 GAF and ANTAR domain-containing protein [Rhodococcus globerulus]